MTKLVVAMLLGVSAAACGGAEDPSSEHDGHHGHMEELEDDFKGCPSEVPAFEPGLEAAGEQYTVRLISADPAEPERYRNDWIVDLSPPDAQLARGQTFMPVHGHDGRVQPQLLPLAEPGQFAVEQLNFTMRGPWEVRLWVSDGAAEDLVVFDVCVAK